MSVIPTALVCVLFGPAMPSLLSYAIFVLIFILVTVVSFCFVRKDRFGVWSPTSGNDSVKQLFSLASWEVLIITRVA